MTKTLGVGIIGCGNISTTYLTLAPLFDRIFYGYGDYFIRLLLAAWRAQWRILEVPVGEAPVELPLAGQNGPHQVHCAPGRTLRGEREAEEAEAEVDSCCVRESRHDSLWTPPSS